MTPLETYSVANFIQDSVDLIQDIHRRGKLPLLVGGTMMYYNGLLNGISILPEADWTIRTKLEARGMEIGWDLLHQELMQIDHLAANKIMPNDKQRIVRALEVFQLTGLPITQLQQQNKVHLAKDIDFLPLAILPETRIVLHKRIELRFKKMLEQGFIREVEQLQQKYPSLTIEHTSMRCVGYYQAWQYLLGKLSYEQLIEAGIVATRQLAKRQITWLRNMKIINLDVEDNLQIDSLYDKLLCQIKKFNVNEI